MMAEQDHPTSSTCSMHMSVPRKRSRRHSDSEEHSAGSNSCSPSSRSRTSSESPINVPMRTCDWTEENICNRLQITCKQNDDPYSLFANSYIAMQKDTKFYNIFLERFRDQVKTNEIKKACFDYTLEMFDPDFKMRKTCFEYVLNNWQDMLIDCEYINQINVSHALKMRTELSNFRMSSLSKWLEQQEMKDIMQGTCQCIYSRLKLFNDQLLFMMNSSHREKPVTEKMFQDLFFAFVRIFDLQIHDTSDSLSYFFKIDNKVVISEPDAVICKFTELESSASSQLELSVFAVVDVTKYYSKAKEEDDILEHLRSSAKTTQSVAEHVNCKTKLQHIGEMLAVTQSSSAFGMNGVFGFIVQGTKVTLASLEVSDDFFENINTKGNTKSASGIVKYSKECNILLKRGRHELISTLLGMASLFKVN